MKQPETKKDIQLLLEKMLDAIKPYYSEGGALLNLGATSAHYPDGVSMLEGFARPLWGLAPYWAGGAENADFEKIYINGLANGTNPQSTEYWDAQGEVNQRYVEMAAIALALLLVPQKLWAPLGEESKNNLAGWLSKINTIDVNAYPDCNWWFFVVLVNLALKNVGRTYSQKLMHHALARVEDFYIEGGWYQDGTSGRKDYYVPFAIHFYSLLYAVFMEKEDPERAALYKDRAGKFARDFLYWFDDDGRAVPYGRSLTYRFAQASFWGAYAFAGLDTVEPAVVKGIIMRHLHHWMNQPVFDRDGVLTIGYHYPNLNMAETYNAPGSPYWALKPFIILALPDKHPFWQAPAADMPKLEGLKSFKAPGAIIQRCKGHVSLYPDGVFRNDDFGHMPEKYGKFVYSTEFGFSVSTGDYDITLAAPDSMLAFNVDGYIFCRRSAQSHEIEDGRILTQWSPIKGITVQTSIIPEENGHIRTHKIINSLGACTAYDCGFAIEAKSPVEYTSMQKAEYASAENSRAKVSSVCIKGGGEGTVIIPAPNTNLMYTKTALPAVKYTIPHGESVIETRFEAFIKE